MKSKKELKADLPSVRSVSYVIGGLLLLSLVLTIWMGLEAFRVVFGSVFVLFLPGFFLTYNFFKEQDWLERIALSFALSIAIVPLITFYLSLLGMPISVLSTSLVIIGILIISTIVFKYQLSLKH